MDEKGDIFEVIRKLRKTPQTLSSKIDGVSSNTEGQFASIYSALYKSVDDHDELMAINRRLNEMIDSSTLFIISRLTFDF